MTKAYGGEQSKRSLRLQDNATTTPRLRSVGAGGEGLNGPSLIDEAKRKDLAAVVAFVKDPKAPMPKLYPRPLTEEDVRAVAAYVRTLKH